jgi:hypothetical protein
MLVTFFVAYCFKEYSDFTNRDNAYSCYCPSVTDNKNVRHESESDSLLSAP